MTATGSEPEPQTDGKGTEYTVLWKKMDGGWMPEGQFTAQTKEEAIQKALGGEGALENPDEFTYRAVPFSSWKDEFVVETEPRVRRKR